MSSVDSNTDERTKALIDDLLALPAEATWAEFKENNKDPKVIGKLISALSNAACLADQPFAYILWGIRNSDRSIVGTSFVPSRETYGNQTLELWLAQHLQPGVAVVFKTVSYHEYQLVLLEIPAAFTSPVEFDKTAYIRIGSSTPRLSDHQGHLQTLWMRLQSYIWETGITVQYVAGSEILQKLDYPSYFQLTRQPLPDNRDGILDKLIADRLIQKDVGGHFNVTNLGAILFAKRLDDFPSISRKSIRFVSYNGSSRAATVMHRQDGQTGYACGFKQLIDYIDNLLPRNEHVGNVFREESPLYPSIAIRELIANALIHQDMTVTGAGPLVELFKDRLEITNPGEPLVSPERFLDSPPRSRNEAVASLMRRMGLCEEQGTGIDKVLAVVELHQLPPPDFRGESNSVRVVLYAPRSFANMTKDERVRACYQHAALKYVSGELMKNATLCERFGIKAKNAAQASAIIRQALDAKLIRPEDSKHPRAGYVPYWA